MKTLSVVVFFILLSLLCGFGNALKIYQNETQLIRTSDQIVYGKIVEVKSAWNAQNTHIETTAQVLVNDMLKNSDNTTNNTGTILSISVLGGVVGNDSEWVEDMPILINNTEGIFFLKKGSDGKNSVLQISAENNNAAFKQKISTVLQNKDSSTTIPITAMPTTKKAGLIGAPFIVILGGVILMQIRRK